MDLSGGQAPPATQEQILTAPEVAQIRAANPNQPPAAESESAVSLAVSEYEYSHLLGDSDDMNSDATQELEG